MVAKEKQSVQGRVQLILKDNKTGRVVQEKMVKNTIMAGGSELVAKLFCGELNQPISHVGLGTSDNAPEDATLVNLKSPVTPTDDYPDNAKRAPIAFTDNQTVYVSSGPTPGSAKVSFAATFGEAHGNGDLKEAGIFNGETEGVLYNRVTFPVINKADNHTLTLIWEIVFSGATQAT